MAPSEYLAQHGPSTAGEIAAALNVPIEGVYQALVHDEARRVTKVLIQRNGKNIEWIGWELMP